MNRVTHSLGFLPRCFCFSDGPALPRLVYTDRASSGEYTQ